MDNSVRELASVAKIVIDTSATLITRGVELLALLIERLPEEDPLTVTVDEEATDETRMTARLSWDNLGSGNHVTIDWGVPDAVDDDEPPTGTASYRYESAGTYSIDVTDLIDATRRVTVDVTVPFTVTGAP